MGLIRKEKFVCVDCEATGLDPKSNKIIEIAAATFTFDSIIDSKEDLIDPECPIPQHTIEIHHITDEMVNGKPKIQEVLSSYFQLIDQHILIGHAITFDIAILEEAAKNHGISSPLAHLPYLDTLRMARLYGESPSNSLETLRIHFNIEPHGAHRAMSDVLVNIEVFKRLCHKFKVTEELLDRLKKPILLKKMPLGKHKGRFFNEIPLEYLNWAKHQKFDRDLLFSIKHELKNRKKRQDFSQAANPFSSL